MPDRVPGSRLRVARVRAGWPIGALAKAIDQAESTIWRIENRRTKEPSVKTRKALAKALGVKEADLFRKVGK